MTEERLSILEKGWGDDQAFSLERELAAEIRRCWTRLWDFKPDPGHINALPEPLRRYIHDLETRADPAGDIQQIASLMEQRDALLIRCRQLEVEMEDLRNRRDQLIEANNSEVERRREAERTTITLTIRDARIFLKRKREIIALIMAELGR